MPTSKRDYEKEYAQDQKKRKKYRAKLRTERVKRGLTGSDGYANGNGNKHISHKSYAKGKAGGKTTVRSAKNNLGDQPKRGKG